MIYPWHQQQWRQIAEHWQNRPNAWLFTGRENTGKTEFARFTAQALLCETPKDNHEPCGTCTSCHLFAQKSHPDFYELTPEIPEGEAVGRKLLQIKIDAVRGIVDGIHLTSVRGGLRVVLVHPAEGMNLQAANSLLKVLEEPPEHVVFLLVTHARDKLLPTIKSRCRQSGTALPAGTRRRSGRGAAGLPQRRPVVRTCARVGRAARRTAPPARRPAPAGDSGLRGGIRPAKATVGGVYRLDAEMAARCRLGATKNVAAVLPRIRRAIGGYGGKDRSGGFVCLGRPSERPQPLRIPYLKC